MLALSKKIVVLLSAALCMPHLLVALSSLSKNDPYPMYTALDPHTFLFRHAREEAKGFVSMRDGQESWSITFAPFGQNADCARPLDYLVGCHRDTDHDIEIGDIEGRWSMLAMLFGRTPTDTKNTLPKDLEEARNIIFPVDPFGTTPPTPPTAYPIGDPEDYVDPREEIGFFSIPVKYRKRGMRFKFCSQFTCNMGMELEWGVSEICQIVGDMHNLTDESTTTSVLQRIVNGQDDANPTKIPPQPLDSPEKVKEAINTYLMTEVCQIADQSGLDIGNFRKFAPEDLRWRLYWRSMYEPCRNKPGFPEFLCLPFFALEGTFPTGSKRKPCQIFGLSSGNDGHYSLGAVGGFNFDFVETVEFGCHAGATHFFGRNINDVPMPTSKFQQGLFPFKASSVHVQPGFNWEFGAKLSAFHLFDCFSFYIQYLYVHHFKNKICLTSPELTTIDNPGPIFLPNVLSKRTSWKNQFINTAFTYDISPCITFGFLWQAPISQRNAYRSSTVLLDLTFTF